MKRIIYFHGLQSKQGGERIDYLSSKYLVHAPEMVYSEKNTWPTTADKVQKVLPEMIVGSSMGGLMGFYSGYTLPINLLLFNPAFQLMPDYIPDWKCNSQMQKATITVILGKRDTDIDPQTTIKYLEQNKIKANITWYDFQHRIPMEIFLEAFEQFEKKPTL